MAATEVFSNIKDLALFLNKKKLVAIDYGVDVIAEFAFPIQELYDTENKDVYSQKHRTFACLLFYYAPQGFTYLREEMKLKLPSLQEVGKWLITTDEYPGFTFQSLEIIKKEVERAGHPLYCCLSVDILGVGKSYENIDIGDEFYRQDFKQYLDYTRGILFYYITCLNHSLKIPVGYFQVGFMFPTQEANMLFRCLEILHETGIQVVAVTFSNFNQKNRGKEMEEMLGISLQADNMKTTFFHPVTKEPISVFVDPKDLMEPLSESLKTESPFLNNKKQIIHWQYFDNLNRLQDQEDLIFWRRLRCDNENKIKKKVKYEIVTRPVPKKPKIKYFNYSQKEEECIEIFHNLYEILKSRSSKEKGFKRCLDMENKEEVFKFLKYAEDYINSLKSIKGLTDPEYKVPNAFIGLLICIISIRELYKYLIESKKMEKLNLIDVSMENIKRISNDAHIHSFKKDLDCWLDCPSEFRYYYEEYVALFPKGAATLEYTLNHPARTGLKTIQITNIKKFELRQDEIDEDSIVLGFLFPQLFPKKNKKLSPVTFKYGLPRSGEFDKEITSYNACLVVSCLLRQIKCEECKLALLSKQCYRRRACLTIYKEMSHLKYLSQDTIKLCEMAEKKIRYLLDSNRKWQKAINDNVFKIYLEVNIYNLTNSIFEDILETKIFDDLYCHQFDQSPLENHLVHLVKAVVEKYIDIRFNE